MQQVEDYAADAKAAIDEYHVARRRYADAVREEEAAESKRSGAKLDAMLRVMQQPDRRASVVEGQPIKMWPATEAEKYVALDPEYAAYLLNQRNLVHARMRAETDYESARLRAQLAIAVCKATMGVL